LPSVVFVYHVANIQRQIRLVLTARPR